MGPASPSSCWWAAFVAGCALWVTLVAILRHLDSK